MAKGMISAAKRFIFMGFLWFRPVHTHVGTVQDLHFFFRTEQEARIRRCMWFRQVVECSKRRFMMKFQPMRSFLLVL